MASGHSAINIVDASMRDGMHSVRHQFSPEQVAEIARTLDRANVPYVEVAHGDGVGGSSIQYGQAAASDEAYVEAASAAVENARIAVLLVPGIGTIADLDRARAHGSTVARIATHSTEADIAVQHIAWAADHDMQVIGFLMMSHMVEPAQLLEQAQLMAHAGASVVYVVDSAGALVPEHAAARVSALVEGLPCEVGFHAHNNLGCAVGNALAAAAAGATWLDGSVRGFGAGAGNAATEVLCAALERAGYDTGVDVLALMDVAEYVAAPLMDRAPIVDRAALSLGYAGVYSSFMLFAERAGERYGIDARDLLIELGNRKMVGGQEDAIIAVAAEMAGVGAAVS